MDIVKNYYEERNIPENEYCEIDRIVQGCTGIRRSTGQHPGGIIVLPLGENIYSFTPVQHPANDMTTDIITTHFDYHSIDHNLLKLDILGHDDPTMIKTLEEYISSPAMDTEHGETDNRFNATDIPLDEPGRHVLVPEYRRHLALSRQISAAARLGCSWNS